jgi:hypothetical protein
MPERESYQMKKHEVIAIYLVSLTLTVGFLPVCFAEDADEASRAMNEAELDLNSAFIAVAEAANVGGNVAGLLNRLDSASGFLSDANLAFSAGDYEGASLLAVKCSQTIEGLAADAGLLKANAERMKNNALLLTASASGIGLVLLLYLGIVGWRVLKKRFLKQILDMKPEAEGPQ